MNALFLKLYPRANDGDRRGRRARTPAGRKFFEAAGKNFMLQQLLFLGLFCYVFGALFQQTTHTHNMAVLFVDYDAGGAVGQAIRQAYAKLQGPGYPTLYEYSPSEFAGPDNLREAVCRTDYWAALYASAGASDRLHAALTLGNTTYDPTNVLTYIWDEVRYATVADAAIAGSLTTLSDVARVAYATGNGTGGIESVSGATALRVLAQPWVLASTNLQPTTQGSRAIYNTLCIILIMIQEFFYLGTLNALNAAFKTYARLRPLRTTVVRLVISSSFTLFGSLCTAGAIWAFRAGWNVNGAQFVLTWLVLWLFAHLNFQVLDVLTVWIAPGYVPMGLICWIIGNVASILLPLDLSPGFYRLGYLFPAHELYDALLDIWSSGCNPVLGRALPIMFAWEILGLAASALGVWRRCHFATLAEEEEKAHFQERLSAAMEWERSREKEIRAKETKQVREISDGTVAVGKTIVSEISAGDVAAGAASSSESKDDGIADEEKKAAAASDVDATEDAENVRDELSSVIQQTNQRLQRERRTSRAVFGPAFGMPFGGRTVTLMKSDT